MLLLLSMVTWPRCAFSFDDDDDDDGGGDDDGDGDGDDGAAALRDLAAVGWQKRPNIGVKETYVWHVCFTFDLSVILD